MRQKRWTIATLLLILSLLVTACGGAAPPATPTAAPAAAAPTAAPTEAPTAVPTVAPAPTEAGPTLVIWADETRAPVLRTLGDAFQAEYGVTVMVTEKGFGDIRDDLKVTAPTGEGPDIIIGAHDWLGELVQNGLLAEISLGDKADQFQPAAVAAFTFDGKLYGMPYATENVAFIYNPELVTEVPTTWSEVAELAAQLEADGLVKHGFVIQENDPYHFYPIQTAFGGYVFGMEDGAYNPDDVGIDNEGSLNAARWLDQMVKGGHIPAGANTDIINAQFQNGDAAMMIGGPWTLDGLRGSGVPFAVTTLPAEVQPARPFLGVQGFMINAFSKDPLLAQTFLQEFVATDEVMLEIAIRGTRPSAYLPAMAASEDPDLPKFADAAVEGMAMPAIPAMSAVWSSWGNAMQLVIQQNEAPDKAFLDAAEQIRTAIADQ